MTDTAKDSGWLPCRRCKGTSTYSWTEGQSGPCFLCNGTGDGRIQNRSGIGPRRARRYGAKNGNGAILVPTPVPAPAPAPSQSLGEMLRDAPMPMPHHGNGAMSAAEHLAAAMAAMQQSAPVDADMVRQILTAEFAESGAKLAKLIDDTVATRAKLRDMIAGLPQRMTITVGNDHLGELPAVRHPMVESLILFVAQSVPVYIVGPAGSGKTTGAHQVAEALGLPFYMQGAMSGSHEILGFVDAHSRYQTTPWRQAYEHGGVMLLDEIDASDPAALLAANAGISNGHMAFPDQAEPVKRHADFRLIAAANTFGTGADRQYVGRSQLDAATLDRFAFLEWCYDETLERQLASNDEWLAFVQQVRAASAKLSLRHIVSPRATIMGGTMLAAGMTRAMVESAFIWKGMPESDQARVRGALA